MTAKWKRRNLSNEKYKRAFLSDKKKQKKAYREASDIRKFEIELFWKRATFFWAFIVAIYTAYYHVLTTIYKKGLEPCVSYEHGTLPLLVLSGLGLFFCCSWLLSSMGSKHWQKNWENHLDLLEDSVTGPLHKIYDAGKAYSESKITIAAGWVVTVCAYGLLIFEFLSLVKKRVSETGFLSFFIVLFFGMAVFLLLLLYAKLMTGNTESSGSIIFQIKKYEDSNE